MLLSVLLNVLFIILINNSVCYVNNKNKIMYNFDNYYRNDNNLSGVKGILFEKKDQKSYFVDQNNHTLHENDHIINEYDASLNTDIMKMINDFTIFIMRNDW